jgi:DeoR family fructose operon transcriptional repressor
MTIRRELQELEAVGVARRVRGGAVAVGTGPAPFAERHRHQAKAKSRIAAKLAELLPTTGAVGLDASSTLLRLATTLEGARELTVVTNGLETFAALQGKPGVNPIITGGRIEPQTGSLVGPVATRTASSLLLEQLFISAAAVDVAVGSSEACLPEAEVKRVFASVSGSVVLAVDSTKLGTRAMARCFEWPDISLLVTELDPPDRRLDQYRANVKIL